MTSGCWAAKLSDCAGGLSREHYISDGIFDGQTVTAYGLSWCKDQPIQIGLAGAVSKILCKRHNEALSPFDGEAAKFGQFLSENVFDDPLSDDSITLRGDFLEKWALKTFVNLAFIGALDHDYHSRTEPSDDLVDYILRCPVPAKGIGLYFVNGAITNDRFKVGLSWKGIRNLSNGGAIAGMTFALNGVNFVVSAESGDIEERLRRVGAVDNIDYSQAKIVYRPSNIHLRSKTAGQKSIFLNW